AARISEAQREALAGLDEPGIDILCDLLDSLHMNPATSTGQLLERWRDHPAAERLNRLAAEQTIVPDAAAAGDELRTALQKLAQGADSAELDALLAQEKQGGLDQAGRERLLDLLQKSRR
ncbi:MAG TPA: hypothetical protein VN755_08225, partial [Steroidobacteraceae bacterium]|nr:hypothetical protein [Steroidobacteraceae bacterium]